MLTRTWFHTGAFTDAPAVTQQYLSEYWTEPALRAPGPGRRRRRDAAARHRAARTASDAFEIQEAYRALKGHALRIEIYADDGSPAAANPYTVTEQNFTIRCLQHHGREPARGVLRRIRGRRCRSTTSASRDDPRVSHEITLRGR